MAEPTAASALAREMLARAVLLAEKSPVVDANPRVGCVLVDADGVVVGEGFHHGAGTAHAEIEALRAAGNFAKGATAYVSLEPCNHFGRTGPCTQALIEAGVAKVVYAVADPNPQAAGGAETLRQAGVETQYLPLPAAELSNRTWLFAQRNRRPFVTWKFAATLDGRSAAADGTSQWITGVEARADVHRLRAQCGAIVVGTGTVLADDPRLTVRHPDGTDAETQPVRVVLGSRPIPPDARVFDDAAPTQVLSASPQQALEIIAQQGIHHVWLEGGPTLAASFLAANLVDEVVVYLAPALLGAGKPAVSDYGVTSIADLRRWQLADVQRFGDDIRLIIRQPAAAN